MKQVILNVLSNAVDFTPEGGKIQITTSKSKDSENVECIRIEINDNGPRIPESIISKIFDPYFTTKHKGSLYHGTGLGLFISHQNMRDHGGSIEVKSKVNKGSTFILTLPNLPLERTR